MSSGPGGSGTGGSAPSQKHCIHCKYCDEKPLVKNYPAHLSRKHPNEDQNDRTGKGGQSLLTFFPKRSRSSDDADSKNKKRNCSGSGDSAIELEDRELEEDFGSTNLAPVNLSDEDADDVQQQSSSEAGGAGLPGQVGKLPQDFGSTNLAPVNVSGENDKRGDTDRDFEKELFLLSKAGCDIGTINISANLIGIFRPFLHKTIKQKFLRINH